MKKLESLQQAGRVAFYILEQIESMVKPGLNVIDLENFATQEILEANTKPAFLGYKGYPAVTCISVNSAIVHGIPQAKTLKNGDVLTVDLGVTKNGWIVDTARSYGVGSVKPAHQKLLEVTKKALHEGIKQCQPGKTVGDISNAIQKTVEEAGFAVVRELTGHGVGRTLQEAPTIPNFGRPGSGTVLKEGMVLAIEPITAVKPVHVVVLDDNWTVASADQSVVSAHYEHTIYISASGPIVLTDGS